MNMTTRILQAGFITLACIGTGCLAKAQQSKKPNILFIFRTNTGCSHWDS